MPRCRRAFHLGPRRDCIPAPASWDGGAPARSNPRRGREDPADTAAEMPPSQRQPFVESLTAVQAVEWQLRCTQLAFAIIIGVSAGAWADGFGMAVALGAAGMALVLVGWAVRRPWAI